METQDFRSLQEAYMEVYASQEELDEASSRDEFTRAAIARNSGRKGGITFEPGPNWDPSANRGKGAHLSPKQKEKQRRKALRQENVDLYDIILSHLLDEGYAETPEAAEVIMVNMSEEWRESIVEEVLDEAIRNPESRKKLRAIMDREVTKGDKSKGQNPRRKYLTKKGDQAFGLLMSRDETGSKGNPVRKRGGTNAPADERVGRGPHRAGNAAYWAGNAGPNRDQGQGNRNRRRRGIDVPNTRDED